MKCATIDCILSWRVAPFIDLQYCKITLGLTTAPVHAPISIRDSSPTSSLLLRLLLLLSSNPQYCDTEPHSINNKQLAVQLIRPAGTYHDSRSTE